jgi:PAS domain S-box-containing protein
MPSQKKRPKKKENRKRKPQNKLPAAKNLPISDVFSHLPDATFAIDHEGKVIAWNRAMEKSTGVMAADIIGKGDHEYALPFYGKKRPLLIDLIDEPDEKIREWGYISIRRKGNALMAENPTIDPDNTVRILWGLAAPINDSGGNRIGAVQSIADITTRWRRETVLENTVMKFQEILDNIGTATLIIEEDDTISFINPEFGRILGYTRDEIEGKKKWMEFVVPEDVRRSMRFMTRASVKDDGPVHIEVRFIRWDGEVRNALLTMTRIPGTQKLVAAILDITDKIRAETAVQLANRKLNFLNKIIRHDILNHLTVLKGNIDLDRETNTDPHQGAVLDKEFAATEAIQALITFTRDYQDIGIAPPEWQDVKQSIMKSCAGIRLGEISLSVEIAGVEIYADRLLSTVFLHLVENAIRHGKKTTRVRLFCEESFEVLHIVCEDDGIGVPPGAKEKIFNRQFFNRTGLEMYLTHEILSITGITIRETGIYGEGACFELCVPKGGYRFIAAQQ